jgi:hypothetical protein
MTPSPDNLSRPKGPSRRAFVLGAAVAAATGGAAVGVWNAFRRTDPPQPGVAMNPRLFSFVGGTGGAWSVIGMKAVVGDALPTVAALDIVNGPAAEPPGGWLLRGVTSNERYATRAEKTQLVAKQAALGRPEATHAALIPIRKSAAWWALTQDERRAVFEDQSRHTHVGLKYLPAVARRLHHCRDLDRPEPFDFLTLFDYTAADAAAFEDLVAALRATAEWKYVDREVDIRLVRG